MKWKIFLTACVNMFFIAFPGNIIGCGPQADPYDYYTSFFNNELSDVKGYRPFYYTGYNFLYDETEPASVTDVLSAEWADYCGNSVSPKDAYNFINTYSRKDVNNLYQNIEKNQSLSVPDSIKSNSMANYFLKNKDLEALGYILYAKQAEPYVGGSAEYWEPIKRDSSKMDKLAKNGMQLYNAAKKDLFKLKYAYQVMRLHHYSNHFTEVPHIYDEYVKNNPAQSLLQALCLSLKAGALYHLNNKQEAAYLFSKAFAASSVKRISNYISFNWSIDRNADKRTYLSMCKNDNEKAAILSLFALGNPGNELETLKGIFSLNPASGELEILSIREINKLEENYFSPLLSKERGGRKFYYFWPNDDDSIYTASKNEGSKLVEFLHTASKNKLVKNSALYEIGAAYCSYIMRDIASAKKYLSSAEKMKLTDKIRDQWMLTNLLVTINDKEKIDADFEQQLLSSVQWLEGKARVNEDWKRFYRNLMSEILAQRYHQQGEVFKEVLAIGAADWIYTTKENDWYGGNALDFLRNNLSLTDVEKLYALLDSKQQNKFESYLITHNSLTKDDVVDFLGTAYLREYDFENAIKWLKKVNNDKNKVINKNPFIDLTYDQEEQLPVEKNFTTTKLSFAEEMLMLKNTAESSKANAAETYYKMATGFYNITYYGHAWELVQYYRSGADGYYIPKDATAFQKEYYGCFTAEKYFEKAMNASADKNFKARCLFMMAKCAQKLIASPQLDDYRTNYDEYDAAVIAHRKKFKASKYFPQLTKEYGTTPFYQQVFNTCSYLRDFVGQK